VLANWIPVHRRGRAIGFVGTGYQITGALTFVVSGFAAEHFGWRGALFVPAAILVVAAIAMLALLDDRPKHASGLASAEAEADSGGSHTSLLGTVWLTLSNPLLWILGLSLGLLDACRYGFIDWGLAHLSEVQKSGEAAAAMKYAVLPAGGAAGALVAGWASDRFFDSRRAPMACILLVMLGGCCLIYDDVTAYSVPGTVALLALIGFCVFGPQVLLVGTAPADMARGGASAAAAGFVNSMGYAGAAVGDYFTGRSLSSAGWQQTINLWAGWAFASAVAAALLWRVRAQPSVAALAERKP
jgi:OPA family glycerol-3-phosphate transporter-like MFS transporter